MSLKFNNLPKFYTTQATSSIITLGENDSRHAIKSLRLRVGDKMDIIDGMGNSFITEIVDDNPKKTTAKILKKVTYMADIPLHLAFCPTKSNTKNELIVEKAVEIGATTISPIFSQNSERRYWNSKRMEKIVIAAIKQSKRYWLPEIKDPSTFSEFIDSVEEIQHNLIAHCKEGKKTPLSKLVDCTIAQLILIGPEGDFTENEIALALQNNFKAVELGSNRLRTETACMVALALMKNN